MRWRRALLGVALAAVCGIGAFLVFAWGATTVTRETSADAEARAAGVREVFDDPAPLLVRDATGRFSRRDPARPAVPSALAELHVYVYRAAQQRSYYAEIPFWFFRLKAPAAELAMRGTGFDLATLGLTAEDLEREGEGIVLDDRDASGDRLLIWTRR